MTMEYLVRFTQVHESFREAELRALARLENVDLEIVTYSNNSPFCIVRLSSETDAYRILRRSILAKAIYELWGMGTSYSDLHHNVCERTYHRWSAYKNASFKFSLDSFQGSRTTAEQRALIDGFRYLDFTGPIRMKNAENEFCIAEQWQLRPTVMENSKPEAIYFGRYINGSERDIVGKYDLKKRKYISTTSMDSELALVTANITLAAVGKLFYDPFVGTGSFPIACAHFGATTWGSDIDGRSIRGKGQAGLLSNFQQYDLTSFFGDSFVADLTNTPVRISAIFDGIICDPPYGVREGLKVLGSRDVNKAKTAVLVGDKAPYLREDYIPPKKPYSFLAMLDDILDFAYVTLVPGGRLSFWMPTSNEKDEEIPPPTHPCLQISSICTQSFNKWSRKLITYEKIEGDSSQHIRQSRTQIVGTNADDMNPFRKRYFEGFKD